MARRLSEATVVITGASSGIGRASAVRFARAGSNLVLAARSVDGLDAVAEECRRHGVRVQAVPTDVARPEAVAELASCALQRFGGIDVWVNNAGVMSYGNIQDIPADALQRVVEVNLLGTMLGTRAAIRAMQAADGGVVINVSSLYGKVATPYVSAYSATKFGILGFSQAVRQELRGSNVDLCVVLPGSMDTPIFGHAANYLGKSVRPPPPTAAPERAARAVVRCARRPRRQVNVGQLQHVLSWGHALLPGAWAATAPSATRLLAVGEEDVAPHDGNLYAPQPETDAVHGGWRSRLRRFVSDRVGYP